MQNNGPCVVNAPCPRRRRCPIGSHKERIGDDYVCIANNDGYVGKRNRRSCRKNQVCLARRRCKNGTRRKRNAAGQMVCRRVRGVPTPTPDRGPDVPNSPGLRIYNHGPPSSVVTANNAAEQEMLNALAGNESPPSLFEPGPGVAAVPVQPVAPIGLPAATSLQEAESEYNREALIQEAMQQDALQTTASSALNSSRRGSNINRFENVFASRNIPSLNAQRSRGQNININNPRPLNDYVNSYQPIFEADELAEDAAINEPIVDNDVQYEDGFADVPQYDDALENVAENETPVAASPVAPAPVPSPVAAPVPSPVAAPVPPPVAAPANPTPNAGRNPIGKVPQNKRNPKSNVLPYEPMMTRNRKRESAIANRLPVRSVRNKKNISKSTSSGQNSKTRKTRDGNKRKKP